MSTSTEKISTSHFLQTHYAFLLFRLTAFISIPLCIFVCTLNLWEHNLDLLLINASFFILSVVASYMFRKNTFPNHWQLKGNIFLLLSSILQGGAALALHNNTELFIIRNLILCWLIGGQSYLINFIVQIIFFVTINFFKVEDQIHFDLNLIRGPLNLAIWIGLFSVFLVIYRKKMVVYFFSTQQAMNNINQQLETATKKIKSKQNQLTEAENQSAILTHKMKQSKKSIETLIEHLDNVNTPKVKLLKQNLQQNINNPDSDYSIVNAVTRSNEVFIQNLNRLHPTLTAYEVNLLSLLLLKLNTKQICEQLLITEGSLRKAKTRLRKKLALADRTNLYDYAISLS